MPKFQGKPISENKEWCKYILSLNKTLGLHGVTHEFEEFNSNRNQTYPEKGIKIFEECFGFKPEMFKPPKIEISNKNKELIKNNDLKLKGKINQVIPKGCPYGNTEKFSNKFIDFF